MSKFIFFEKKVSIFFMKFASFPMVILNFVFGCHRTSFEILCRNKNCRKFFSSGKIRKIYSLRGDKYLAHCFFQKCEEFIEKYANEFLKRKRERSISELCKSYRNHRYALIMLYAYCFCYLSKHTKNFLKLY